MADYPSFVQVKGSKRKILSGILLDRAINGTPRRRVTYSSDKYEFEVHHILDETDWNSLLSHYSLDKSNSFNFTWEGDATTYSVEYASEPEEVSLEAGIREVVTRLVSV